MQSAATATTVAARAVSQITVPSPVGALTLREVDGRIVSVSWSEGRDAADTETPLLLTAAQQLNAYFYCGLRDFDLPLAPAGSTFEHAVWDQMLRIPYGQTRSYGEIARAVDGMPQAVGGACGSNPIPIIIPCHRVLAANGRSGGYSGRGGTQTKHFLLALEGATLL
jgi:methylated-DNA-[protein]-cysteine S-methyltransferase